MGSQEALVISSYPAKPQPAPASVQKTKAEDGEIDVFGAEKYFNMKLDFDEDAAGSHNHTVRLPNQADHLHQMAPKRRTRGPPSVSSESSWNSQTALLRNLSRNRPHNNNNQHTGKGFLSGLSCSGSCKKVKSVSVNDTTHQGRAHGNHKPGSETVSVSLSSREGHSSPKFRIQSPRAAKIQVMRDHKLREAELMRKELHGYGPGAIVTKGDIVVKLEKRLSMLTWDAIPNAPMLPAITRGSQIIEEIESDGSSDLFEIESFPGIDKASFARQETDGMSSCLDAYEPSETSIEWSVVTASAADASVVSDYDEARFARNGRNMGSRLDRKEGPKNKPGGILGCKSVKAVEVAEPSYRRNVRGRA